MKITLDIPDKTKGMFINYIYRDGFSYAMAVHSSDIDELFDGAEILVRPETAQEGK